MVVGALGSVEPSESAMANSGYATPGPRGRMDDVMGGHSAPPVGAGGGGAMQRGSSVRRRLAPEMGLSPKAKRPAAYVQPGPNLPGQQIIDSVSEILQTKQPRGC